MQIEKSFDEKIEQNAPSEEIQNKFNEMDNHEWLIYRCERANQKLMPTFDSLLYHCDKCNDSGYHYELQKYEYVDRNNNVIDGEEVVAVPCECLRIRESLQALKDSGLTKIMQEHTFDTYKTEFDWQKAIKSKAEEYVKNEVATFYIGGFTGSGKTKICSCMLNEFLKQKKSVKYVVWNDFIADLKSDFETANEKVAKLQKVDVLYIDDLYKFNPSDFEKKVLFLIVNYRTRANMKTLFSSEVKVINKDESKIVDLYSLDLAVAGRIWESAEKGKFVIAIPNEQKYNMRFREI